MIIKAAYDLPVRSFSDLIDHRLPKKVEERIKEIICDHASDYAGFHDLRTRHSEPEIFIEFHLAMPRRISVQQSHDLADHFESDLIVEFLRSNISIHTEPCNEGSTHCGSFCTFFEKIKS